jgi:hypothetical protein
MSTPWTAFVLLLLVEAVAVAVVVLLAMRRHAVSRVAGTIVVLGVVAAPIAALLHNVLSALVGGEEIVTLLLALVGAPVGIVAGTIAVALSLRAMDHDLAVGLGIAGAGLALFPLYTLIAIAADAVIGAVPFHGALETLFLSMCLVVTALGVAYSGIVLVARRRALA